MIGRALLLKAHLLLRNGAIHMPTNGLLPEAGLRARGLVSHNGTFPLTLARGTS
jgi:hypothetical protein